MTINTDRTAIIQVIASIGILVAPNTEAVILTNDAALRPYSLILAIHRPIEIPVLSLNVVGNTFTSVIVTKKRSYIR